MVDELNFTVDSQLMGELGERLVSKNHVALAEVIKNSYDADATKLNIKFENVTGGDYKANGKITISDTGSGMSLTNVKTYWMRIATANKLSNPHSAKYGRPRTGKKGIGRFACQKLARELSLETIGKTDNNGLEETKVFFKWNNFVSGKDISEIGSIYENKKVEGGDTGTTLVLTKLTDKWTRSDFNTLKRHILELTIARGIKRKGFEEDPGFEITIEADEFGDNEKLKNISLFEEFRNAGWGTITATVDNSGAATINLDAKDLKNKTYSPNVKFEKLRGITLDVQWIPWRLTSYLRNPVMLKKYVTREIMQEFGGIRVYYNNFLVYPYGTKGDDWLSIDRDQARSLGPLPGESILQLEVKRLGLQNSRPMLHMPKNQNLYGSVRISDEKNKNFEIQINREGFVENGSFRELRDFVRLCVDWATLQYSWYEKKKAEETLEYEAQELRKISRDITSDSNSNTSSEAAVQSALNLIKTTATLNLQSDSDSKKNLNIAARVMEKSIQNKNLQITLLQNVASINSIMLTFGHEARDLVNRINLNAKELRGMLPSFKEDKKVKLLDAIKSLETTKERFTNQLKLFGILGRRSNSLEELRYYVKNPIADIAQAFSFITNKYDISIETDFEDEQKTPKMFEPEFYTILINLLSNSIKSVLASGEHKIKISVYNENDKKFILRVYDTGVGLAEEHWSSVFEPFNADPEKKMYPKLSILEHADLFTFGQGTGLGLSIVKSITENRGGSARFIKSEKPWKACIEVVLPW